MVFIIGLMGRLTPIQLGKEEVLGKISLFKMY